MGNKAESEMQDMGEELSVDEALRMTESLVNSLDDEDVNGFSSNPLSNNPYFRFLGFHEGEMVLANKRTAYIQYVKTDKLGSKVCLSLAPFEFWKGIAPRLNEKGQPTDGVMWERVMDLMFRASEDAGLWNDRNQHAQGACYDRGRVAFHTGEKVWMEHVGLMNPGDVQGEHCYTARIGARLPDFNAPFEAGSKEIRALLNIIKALAWREDSRALSEMTLFGYLQIAPMCGILSWRPHVWLDGARGDGKTWVVQNIVNRVLGPHCEMVKSNSTESGLRNLLHARSIPTVFDEAEGSSPRDKARMEEIISLARHTSSETDAVVAQGVSGGGASRRYEVSSMFFFASIATRIDKPSDKTRFARISLGPGLRGRDFVEQVEVPALKLMTDSFTDKFIARSVLRAKDAGEIIRVMTAALMLSGMERRVADVYGVFAAGAWMALRDGIPENEKMCLQFIKDEFGALEQIQSVNTDLSQDRDHDRVIRQILSSTRRIETANGPVSSEKVGILMQIVAGFSEKDDSLITVSDALRELNNMGIRPAKDGVACDPGEHVTHFLLHRKSDAIRTILEKTPYETGFAELILQAPGVRVASGSTRFRGAAPERGLLIPLCVLFGEDPEDTQDVAEPGQVLSEIAKHFVSEEPRNSGSSSVPISGPRYATSDPFEEGDAFMPPVKGNAIAKSDSEDSFPDIPWPEPEKVSKKNDSSG